VLITVTYDNYYSETDWRLFNDNGVQVATLDGDQVNGCFAVGTELQVNMYFYYQV
jgi:hypothetical protein